MARASTVPRGMTVFIVALLAALCTVRRALAQGVNIDGGRSDLPGMKRDMFDQAQRAKKAGASAGGMGRGPPECPKSDGMSPFYSLAFVSGEIYVRANSTEGKCQRLISVGGANYSDLINASRTCGPAGEWKRKIAEELSAMFFQGGFEWVRSENETLEIITEDGAFDATVSEAKYKEQLECWRYACGCEQANNPIGRAIFAALLVIAVAGQFYDALKLARSKLYGSKPPSRVECPKGHKMGEVSLHRSHYCDVCGTAGTSYACAASCNYDMCKKCYKVARKKVKTTMKEWQDKHPEEKKKSKSKGGEEDEDETKKEDSEDGGASERRDAESEADSTKKDAADSEADSSTKKDAAESEADSAKKDAEEEEEEEDTTAEAATTFGKESDEVPKGGDE